MESARIQKILVACKIFDYTYVPSYTQGQLVEYWTKHTLVELLKNNTPKVIDCWADEVCCVLNNCGLPVYYEYTTEEPNYCEIHLKYDMEIEN